VGRPSLAGQALARLGRSPPRRHAGFPVARLHGERGRRPCAGATSPVQRFDGRAGPNWTRIKSGGLTNTAGLERGVCQRARGRAADSPCENAQFTRSGGLHPSISAWRQGKSRRATPPESAPDVDRFDRRPLVQDIASRLLRLDVATNPFHHVDDRPRSGRRCRMSSGTRTPPG